MQLAPVSVECVLLEEITQATNSPGVPPMIVIVRRRFDTAWSAKNKPPVRKM
jgi:hypothetical protein